MNTTDEFIELFKELEDIAKAQYHYPNDGKTVLYLEDRPEFRYIKAELGCCRDIRNILQHKPKYKGDYTVTPSENMLSLLKDVIEKVKNPIRARDIAILISKVFYRSLDDYVKPALIEMRNKVFTHVPILDQSNKVIGVFSESTLLSYLVDDEIVGIDDNTRFIDFKKYLPIDKHLAESFLFVKQSLPLEDVRIKFENALKGKKRLGLLLVTNNGKENEPLQGIISAWDVAGK